MGVSVTDITDLFGGEPSDKKADDGASVGTTDVDSLGSIDMASFGTIEWSPPAKKARTSSKPKQTQEGEQEQPVGSSELNISLLRMLKTRDGYDAWAPLVPSGLFNRITYKVIEELGEWYEKTGLTNFDADAFRSTMWLNHPGWKEDLRDRLDEEFRQMEQPNPEGVEKLLRNQLYEASLKRRLEKHLESSSGIDLVHGLREELDQAERSIGQEGEDDGEVTDSISDILSAELDDHGYTWPLDCLNNAMRPLRGGDMGIIAARPDTGKTSTIAFLVKHFLPQIPEGGTILWLNNEGAGKRIVVRLVQAALGLASEELAELAPGEAEARLEKMYGDRKWKVLDVHGKSMASLVEIIKRRKPSLVVFDMLDNVEASGAKDRDRTDQILKKLYETARNTAVQLDIPVLATSQLSADADGEMFPLQKTLSDSRTGKPGACDFILMVGKKNDPLQANKRWLSLTKNKLTKLNGKKDPRQEIEFDEVRCVFTEVKKKIAIPLVGKRGSDAWIEAEE